MPIVNNKSILINITVIYFLIPLNNHDVYHIIAYQQRFVKLFFYLLKVISILNYSISLKYNFTHNIMNFLSFITSQNILNCN